MATSINSQQELQKFLITGGVDTSAWGNKNAKSVLDLWHEIEQGESKLVTEPLQRTVFVVELLIQRGPWLLIEQEQAFADGRLRPRQRPPAEKMKPGEDYIETAYRCLQEELAIPPDEAQVLPETYRQISRVRESVSYPGLKTVYQLHQVEAQVAGLPPDDFWTPEDNPEPDAVVRHHWTWVLTEQYINKESP